MVRNDVLLCNNSRTFVKDAKEEGMKQERREVRPVENGRNE